jgi:hypothetical protein
MSRRFVPSFWAMVALTLAVSAIVAIVVAFIDANDIRKLNRIACEWRGEAFDYHGFHFYSCESDCRLMFVMPDGVSLRKLDDARREYPRLEEVIDFNGENEFKSEAKHRHETSSLESSREYEYYKYLKEKRFKAQEFTRHVRSGVVLSLYLIIPCLVLVLIKWYASCRVCSERCERAPTVSVRENPVAPAVYTPAPPPRYSPPPPPSQSPSPPPRPVPSPPQSKHFTVDATVSEDGGRRAARRTENPIKPREKKLLPPDFIESDIPPS